MRRTSEKIYRNVEIRRRNFQFQNPVWGQVVELLISILKEQHSKGGYVSSLLGTCATEDLCADSGTVTQSCLKFVFGLYFFGCFCCVLSLGHFPLLFAAFWS